MLNIVIALILPCPAARAHCESWCQLLRSCYLALCKVLNYGAKPAINLLHPWEYNARHLTPDAICSAETHFQALFELFCGFWANVWRFLSMWRAMRAGGVAERGVAFPKFQAQLRAAFDARRSSATSDLRFVCGNGGITWHARNHRMRKCEGSLLKAPRVSLLLCLIRLSPQHKLVTRYYPRPTHRSECLGRQGARTLASQVRRRPSHCLRPPIEPANLLRFLDIYRQHRHGREQTSRHPQPGHTGSLCQQRQGLSPLPERRSARVHKGAIRARTESGSGQLAVAFGHAVSSRGASSQASHLRARCCW